MKKLITFLCWLCVLNVLAAAGIITYLATTGRLDKAKAQSIADMLRHEGTPPQLREQISDLLTPPSTAPASQPGLAAGGAGTMPATTGPALASMGGPATAEERIDFARRAMEQERLRLENEAQDLHHRQELLDHVQGDVEAKLKKIQEQQKAFNDSQTKVQSTGDEEAFQKMMSLFAELKPRQIKDLFTGMQPPLVARYMAAMEPDQAAKIIGEFKTDKEKTFIGEILERIRQPGMNSASGVPTASNQH